MLCPGCCCRRCAADSFVATSIIGSILFRHHHNHNRHVIVRLSIALPIFAIFLSDSNIRLIPVIVFVSPVSLVSIFFVVVVLKYCYCHYGDSSSCCCYWWY